MDDADRAEQYEQRERDKSIERVTSIASEEQLKIEGDVVCIDCIELIPEVRLKHVPNAVRCVSCQEEHEYKSKTTRGH